MKQRWTGRGRGIISVATAVFVLGSSLPSIAQDTSNISCAALLKMPLYPEVARQAMSTATVAAVITLGSAGMVEKLDVETISGTKSSLTKSVFFPEIEKAVNASRFEATCAGKNVRVVFAFRMEPQLPKASRLRFPTSSTLLQNPTQPSWETRRSASLPNTDYRLTPFA